MISKAKIIPIILMVIVGTLFGLASIAAAATIDDVPDNSLVVGYDIYQLPDTNSYTFENILNSILRYQDSGGPSPVPLYFKWSGEWFDLYEDYNSIKDMKPGHEGHIPRSEMIRKQFNNLYGLGDQVEPLEPIRSTYKFAYELPTYISSGIATTIDVGFQTDVLAAAGYEGVIFTFETVRPEGATVTFKATDSSGVEHTFTNSGFWGPLRLRSSC